MSSSTDTTINPLEESIFQEIGRYILCNLTALIVLTLFYGIFIPLFSMSLYMTIRRGLSTRTNWATLIGTSVNFGILTVEWVMALAWLVSILQIFLVHNGNSSLEDRISLEIKTQNHFILPLDNLGSAPLLISDAFVVWRASILFTHKWAKAIPIISLASTVGLFASAAVSMEAVAGTAVSWALSSLSLATNFISTGMIGWRLWMYRKHVLPNVDATKKSPVNGIIMTLVESGTVFCLIQVASLTIQIISGEASTQNPSPTVIAIQQILFSSAAIYPTFIVLICRNQSSRINEVASLSMSVDNDLRFATMRTSQSHSMAAAAVDFSQQSYHSCTHEAKPNIGDRDVEIAAL